MKIGEHCHCGQITFEAEVDPTALTICHCTDCQTLTGSAFRIKYPRAGRAFCAPQRHAEELCEDRKAATNAATPFAVICGTPIYACAVDNPQTYALRVGTITQRAAFSPRWQSWRRSALHWVDALATVPATEKG